MKAGRYNLRIPQVMQDAHCFRCGARIDNWIERTKKNMLPSTLDPILFEVCEWCYWSTRKAIVNHNSGLEASKKRLRPEEWLALLKLSGGRCGYCQEDTGSQRLVIDHLTPVKMGGANALGNVIPACHSCNARKHNRDVASWRRQQRIDDLAALLMKHLELSDRKEVIVLALERLAFHEGLSLDSQENP